MFSASLLLNNTLIADASQHQATQRASAKNNMTLLQKGPGIKGRGVGRLPRKMDAREGFGTSNAQPGPVPGQRTQEAHREADTMAVFRRSPDP